MIRAPALKSGTVSTVLPSDDHLYWVHPITPYPIQYRLRNAIIHTYLTDLATDASGVAAQRPKVVVKPFETGKASQEVNLDASFSQFD